MKNCPKCNVDFSDEFTFCEFDGVTLNKVLVEKQSSALLSRLQEKYRLVQFIGIAFIICLVTLFIFAKTNHKKTPVAANQNRSAYSEQATLYVETPQSAQEYSEESTTSDSQNRQHESNPDNQRDKNKESEKPGVKVFLPDAGQAKDSSPQPVAKPKPLEKAEPVEPKPEPDNRPARNQQANRSQPPTTNQPPTSQPQQNHSSRAQMATNRQLENDESSIQRANSSVSMNLVRLRSYRTDTGIRYDLTLNMQQQEGRVIRWERLNLLTRSSSGIAHTEVVPFYQRLGSSGSLNFTVSVEMRGRADADFQGRITCTGTGTDVEGRSVKTDFTTRVTP